jgi:hypothetical protein
MSSLLVFYRVYRLEILSVMLVFSTQLREFLPLLPSLWLSPVWRIRDVYPGSRILIFTHPGSRILDPGSKNSNKRQEWKQFLCQTIFCSYKFHKTDYYFIFYMLKKKIWPNFPRIIEVFTQKNVTKPSKIWVWDPESGIRDPGSGKNLFRIPDPGAKKAPDPGSGSATLVISPPFPPLFPVWIMEVYCIHLYSVLGGGDGFWASDR